MIANSIEKDHQNLFIACRRHNIYNTQVQVFSYQSIDNLKSLLVYSIGVEGEGSGHWTS